MLFGTYNRRNTRIRSAAVLLTLLSWVGIAVLAIQEESAGEPSVDQGSAYLMPNVTLCRSASSEVSRAALPPAAGKGASHPYSSAAAE